MTTRALTIILMCGAIWLCGCALKHRLERESRQIETLSAASYTSSAARSPSPRADPYVVRLHVMVDEPYRREHMRWRERIEEQVEAASRELRAQCNVELEIVSIKEWAYDGSARTLRDVLSDMRAARPVKEGEDRVLGFTSSLTVATSQHHELGMAYDLGEHLVLRGMQDYAEREFIEETLSRRKRKMSDAIYRARLEHKRVTVLIHEIGHSYGAMHVSEQGQIMSPVYDHKTERFSLINTELLEDGFALDREYTDQPHGAWRRALLASMRERRAQGDQLLGEIPKPDLDERLGEEGSEATFEDAIHLDAVRAALTQKDYDEAWRLLEGELADDPSIEEATMACAIQANKKDDLKALRRWCKEVVDREGQDILYASSMLMSQLLDTEPLFAFEIAQLHEGALMKARDVTPDNWLFLASIYSVCGALTHAGRLTALAGMTKEASSLRDEIITRRHYLSLFGVHADDEPVMYQALMALNPTLFNEDTKERARALSMIEALAPEAPPTIVARCRVAIATQEGADVLAQCADLSKRVPESAMALWGEGVAMMVRGDKSDAVKIWERAIALEPSVSSAWHSLARHHEVEEDSESLDALRHRYEAEFGKPPPW